LGEPLQVEETTSKHDFPLVTVLVAAYNEEKRIGECLDSLLAQTYHPLEILVLDDGSTDRTVLLAESKAGIKVMGGSHQGKARTMNEGAARARGAILVFADADIVYDPDYVNALVRPIRTDQAEGSSHLIEKVANPENIWSRCWQWIAKLPPDQRLCVGPEDLAAGSKVYRALRRDRYLAVGGFDPTG
jgi:glycosyltransferase involved in cell wall biosynthesis